MMHRLIDALLDRSLVLFGCFRSDNAPYGPRPFSLPFHLLASYPDVLELAAAAAAAHLPGVNTSAARLLSAIDSLPLATMVSVMTRIPLVYVWECESEIDLKGAFDIGHVTAMLTLAPSTDSIERIVPHARRLGLDVQQVVSLIGWGEATQRNGVGTVSALRLEDIIERAHRRALISKPQADRLLTWIRLSNGE